MKAKLKRIVAMLTRLAMRSNSAAEPSVCHEPALDYEHEHRFAEHEHEHE